MNLGTVGMRDERMNKKDVAYILRRLESIVGDLVSAFKMGDQTDTQRKHKTTIE